MPSNTLNYQDQWTTNHKIKKRTGSAENMLIVSWEEIQYGKITTNF